MSELVCKVEMKDGQPCQAPVAHPDLGGLCVYHGWLLITRQEFYAHGSARMNQELAERRKAKAAG